MIRDIRFNTCRLCGESELGERAGQLVKYGVRHYAHPACAFKKWGKAFLDKLHVWQIERLPFGTVKAAGISLGELKTYTAQRRRDE